MTGASGSALALMLVLVALGGAAGSVGRVMLGTWVQRYCDNGQRPWAAWFPVGTFFVNITGALAIGILAGSGLMADAGLFGFLGIGILGSYTTVSSLALQTLELSDRGGTMRAGLNMGLTLGFGLGAVVAGYVIGHALLSGAA